MKKKIKDLTEEEIIDICDNHYTECCKCPLYIFGEMECKDMLPEQYGEEEIEVDLNEEKN